MKFVWIFCLAALFVPANSARAELKLPAIFGDHMVLQRGERIPVWGWADPGETVAVALGAGSARAVANARGEWRVELPALRASAGPQTMTVTGSRRKSTAENRKFIDVLIGDVWLCSGQSNMEYALSRSHLGREDKPKATDSQIRIFQLPRTSRAEPQTDVAAKWVVCDPRTAGEFSAVAYYFARELRGDLKLPIGLIGSYWGGTPAQAWTSLEALRASPPFEGYVKQAENNRKRFLETRDSYPAKLAEYQAAKKKWDAEVRPSFDPVLRAWQAEEKAAKAAGRPIPPRPRPSVAEPAAPPDPNPHPGNATALFNGMIAPLIPYAIKGVIWYQGESNASQAAEYATLFPRLISDWRLRWGRGDFPFLFVQVAAYGGARGAENYPLLRESQARALALPNTGMAVSIDIGAGTDIHPPDKKDVGLRLAQAARAVAYGQKVVPSGPLYDAMRIEGSRVRLAFRHVGGGLKMGVPPWRPANAPPLPAELSGFTIAGSDRKWLPAQARIEGNFVVVWNDRVSAPRAVRYGWEGDPVCNLYNREGLPAAPFRTDDWPATAEPSAANSQAQPKWYQQCAARVAAAQGKPVDVIFIGDSITQNFLEHPRPGWNLVGGSVWEKHYGSRNALNFGVGGDGTQNVLWRMDHMNIAHFRPKVVVVLLGINNAGETPADIAGGVRAVIERAQSLYPGVKVISVSLLPNGRAPEKTVEVNRILRAAADSRSVFFLDVWSRMPATPDGRWAGIGGDRLHVTAEGYEIWAAEMEPLLRRLLAEGNRPDNSLRPNG